MSKDKPTLFEKMMGAALVVMAFGLATLVVALATVAVRVAFFGDLG